MLDFLFRRLTADPARGAELFAAVTGVARQPHWFVEGEVPDTLDGRFAVFATVTALVLVRLESDGEAGNSTSVGLTERFVEVMESEHRELGLGDPTLGKTIRKLVGSLARRTALWRGTVAADSTDWDDAARQSLYKDAVSTDAVEHSASALRSFWSQLQHVDPAAIDAGKIQ